MAEENYHGGVDDSHQNEAVDENEADEAKLAKPAISEYCCKNKYCEIFLFLIHFSLLSLKYKFIFQYYYYITQFTLHF